MKYCVRIKNAWIADGSGKRELFKSDILCRDGKISGIEEQILGSCAADLTIDLKGKILAPGFIDVHGHSDVALFADPGGFAKVSQGVTTEIAGNCGLSTFPLGESNRAHLQELYSDYGVELDWHDLASCREKLNKLNASLRLEFLCGHNTLRAFVSGYGDEPMSDERLTAMKEQLEIALQQGALGMSSGLLYVPGKFADEYEVTELMRVLAKYDRIFTTHLRSEGDKLLESMEEIFSCAVRANLKHVHISHFKTSGMANWKKLDDALALIDNYRNRKLKITVDRYPYTESMTQLSVILPDPWSDMDDVAIERSLQNTENIAALENALRSSRTPDYWRSVRLVSTTGEHIADCGKKLTDIADDPVKLVVELLAGNCAGTTAAFAGMSEKNMEKILSLDYCMPGSDGNALPLDYTLGRAHPRAFGAIAKFIRMQLDRNGNIVEAVNRATGLAAETFKLADRGMISPGSAADLVVFDPDTIDGNSDFADPHTPATGILLTIKSGEAVYRTK